MPYVGICRLLTLIGGSLFLLGLAVSHARHARKYFIDGASGLGAFATGLAIVCTVAFVAVIGGGHWAPTLAAIVAASSILGAHWYRRRTRLELAADALVVLFVVASAGRHFCA